MKQSQHQLQLFWRFQSYHMIVIVQMTSAHLRLGPWGEIALPTRHRVCRTQIPVWLLHTTLMEWKTSAVKVCITKIIQINEKALTVKTVCVQQWLLSGQWEPPLYVWLSSCKEKMLTERRRTLNWNYYYCLFQCSPGGHREELQTPEEA